MKMSDWEIGFADDFASLAALAEPSTQDALERVATVWQPMLRSRLTSLLSQVSSELGEIPGIGRVELRLQGDDITFVVEAEAVAPEPGWVPTSTPGDADARISLRISEPLKDRISAAAAAEGMSANTWIARVLEREIAQPRGTHNQPTHTTRNQLRGYGRS